MPPPDKNTSVFLDGTLPHVGDLSHAETRRGGEFFSRKEHKDHKAGGPTSVSATIDRSGWKRVRLGNVLQVCHGKCQHSIESNTGKYPILATSGEIGRTDSYLYDKPSVLIGRKGTIDKPQYIDSPFWTIDTLFYTKIAEGYNPKFLYYLCLTIDWTSMNEASGVPSLSANRIESLEVTIPGVDEQDKISNALSSIDKHVSTLDALIAKYEAIKKATVNLLLEPKSYWRIVPLGETCEVCSTRRVHESDWTDSGVPFYRARELVALNDGRSITPLHISEKLYNELIASSGTIRPGDLLVTGVGSIGVPYLVKENDRFYFKDGNIIWFKNRGEIWPDYFLHAFRSDHIQKQIMEMACVGTVGSYTITNGKRTLIALPPLDEQKRIVEILDSLDGTISGLKSQLAKAQDIKRGMMAYFFG